MINGVDINIVILGAFIAYLVALFATLYSSRESSRTTQRVVYAYPPYPTPHSTYQTQEEPEQAKNYKHTLTATPNQIKLQGLLKQLEAQDINYTLTKQAKGNTTITFTTDKKLQNLEELKKKGIILEAKIEEEKTNPNCRYAC